MAEIELREVTKRYADGTEAVRGATLTIADGELLVLVGPSGCGKSTLLRMIAGLEDISDGELLIGGEVVNDRAPRDRDIAMVFQSYALYPHMTVRENMGFSLKMHGVDKDEIRRRVEDAARTLDLTEHLDRKPANLSGGQRQRVAMGRAIVREPAAYLMDEPLSNLDAKLRVQTRTEISRLQERTRTTTVYVTHDQVEAMTLGDRVAVMRKGVVQQVAAPRVLYSDPVNLFVAQFIGSPAMNMMEAEVRGDAIVLPVGEFAIPDGLRERLGEERTEGRALVAGIRPEHMEDAALVGERAGGATFRSTVEVLESMGSDLYVYMPLEEEHRSDRLGAIAAETETTADQLVARLDPAAGAAEGREIELWIDLARLHLFDAETGESLTSRKESPEAAPAAA